MARKAIFRTSSISIWIQRCLTRATNSRVSTICSYSTLLIAMCRNIEYLITATSLSRSHKSLSFSTDFFLFTSLEYCDKLGILTTFSLAIAPLASFRLSFTFRLCHAHVVYVCKLKLIQLLTYTGRLYLPSPLNKRVFHRENATTK